MNHKYSQKHLRNLAMYTILNILFESAIRGDVNVSVSTLPSKFRPTRCVSCRNFLIQNCLEGNEVPAPYHSKLYIQNVLTIVWSVLCSDSGGTIDTVSWGYSADMDIACSFPCTYRAKSFYFNFIHRSPDRRSVVNQV